MYKLPPEHLRILVGAQITDEDFMRIGQKCVASIIKQLPEQQFNDALDFGCGCGRMLRHLIPAFPNTNWYGCDVNVDAVVWVAEEMPEVTAFVIKPNVNIPLPDSSINLVLAISIYSHFKEWSSSLMELRRILKSGGIIVLSYCGETVLKRYHPDTDYSKLKTMISDPVNCAFNSEFTDSFCLKGWASKTVGRFFKVLKDTPAGLYGYQDLIIAKKS